MGSNDTFVTTDTSGNFSILPQLEQYITELGNQAYQLLVDPYTTPGRFAHEAPLFLPDWNTINYSPLEAQGLQLVQNMVSYGIPQPEAEQLAMQMIQALPGQVGPVAPSSMWSNAMQTAQQVAGLGSEQARETEGFNTLNQGTAQVDPSSMWGNAMNTAQRVTALGIYLARESAGFNTLNQGTNQTPISEFYNQALDTSGQVSNVAGNTSQEQAAEAALLNLTQGDMGNSPAVQSAIQSLESIIVPQIENAAATMGLANSGELVSEIGQAYAGTLTPLYMQGLEQQQSAANTLGAMGNTMASRQMTGLQSLRDTQLAAGQNEEALQTEQMIRQLQAGQAQLGASSNIAQRGMSGLTNQQSLEQSQALNEQSLQTEQLMRQLQAGQVQLGAGSSIAQRGMSGLTNQQNLEQTQALSEQQLGTEAANRAITATTGSATALNPLGTAQTSRFLTPMQYAGQAGDVQHQRAVEQRQFVMDPFLREREMMLSLMNPAEVSVISTSPTTTTQQSSSSGTSK